MPPFIPIFCRIQRHVLNNLLEVGKPLPHGGFLRSLALHGFGGVLRKGGVERIGIPGLEKDEVSAVGVVLFQRKVHAVFYRNVFKGLDVFIVDLDILNPCPCFTSCFTVCLPW